MAEQHTITIPTPHIPTDANIQAHHLTLLSFIDNPNNVEVITTIRYDPALIRSSQNTKVSGGIPSFFYMLDFHRERMLETIKYYDTHMDARMGYSSGNMTYLTETEVFSILTKRCAREYAEYLEKKGCHEQDIIKYRFNRRANEVSLPARPFKVRILARPFQLPEMTFSEVPPADIRCLFPSKLTVPDEKFGCKVQKWALRLDTAPTPSNATTTFKLTHRDLYNAAYKRVITDKVKESAGSAITEVVLYDENGLVTEGSFTSLYFVRDGYWVTPRVTELSKNNDEQEWRGGQRGTTRRWALENGICIEGDVTVDSIEDGERVWVSNGVRGFGYGEIKRTSQPSR